MKAGKVNFGLFLCAKAGRRDPALFHWADVCTHVIFPFLSFSPVQTFAIMIVFPAGIRNFPISPLFNNQAQVPLKLDTIPPIFDSNIFPHF